MNKQTLLNDVVNIAQTAGRAILAIYERDFAVQQKADQSPLTAADLASHQQIIAALSELTPDVPILSEESAEVPYAQRKTWSRYWLVDPLDGTKEFIRRNGEFTVNIALIEQGRPVLGVVYVPTSGVCYAGEVGIGAWKQQRSGERTKIYPALPCEQPLRVVASRSHVSAGLQQMLDQMNEYQLVSMGSSLKLCQVAEGAADVYPRLGPTCEWDTAAAQAVVEAAGGQVTDVTGQPLRYNQKDSLLNPHFLVFADQAAVAAWGL
ncbi:MAG: 3'(2'),5'-bisphosphate nucleotidase CysQ [Pseudomonadota bacterium]